MQQRQLRLGDILDDYCPRERRVTNHAVVAMVGDDVKQTRCTTCDAEHEYKQAKVPRQRRKTDAPAALYAQVLASGPKRVVPESAAPEPAGPGAVEAEEVAEAAIAGAAEPPERGEADEGEAARPDDVEEGPVHRPLIRATLPRPEGQPPPQRPAPEFTIRQPGGRQNRFRHRHAQHGQPPFHGNRSSGGGGPMRSGAPRQGGGRPPVMSRAGKHQGGRKRSK